MARPSVFEQILDFANRADPYPLYAELRKTPVMRQQDGSYVVSTYRETRALLHDPRVSSDAWKAWRDLTQRAGPEQAAAGLPPSLIALDPPEHHRIRLLLSRQFEQLHNARRVSLVIPEMADIVSGLIDRLSGKNQVDLVQDLAYPFPFMVICRLLAVPREDEPRFHVWSREARTSEHALAELGHYLADLAEGRRQPGQDRSDGAVTDDRPAGRMSRAELMSNASLLFFVGHETTVSFIANGMLTLLRNPDVLDRLRHSDDPRLAVRVVEELLRFEPPLQFLPIVRSATADIDIADITIPSGAPITLMLAAANRDPEHIPDPDRFDPGRDDTQHLGFGSGAHYCFGAPLARLEAQIALTEFARRLQRPRLIMDPPPYRKSPVLRGPQHLVVGLDGVVPA